MFIGQSAVVGKTGKIVETRKKKTREIVQYFKER